MLKALYDYGQAHPEVIQHPGCEYRSIQYVADLTGDGGLIGVRKLDKSEQRVMCPSAGNITSKADAHPVADKALVAIRLDPDGILSEKQAAKLAVKRRIFEDRFRSGVPDIPAFQAVCDVLSDSSLLDGLQAGFVEAGGKPGDTVGFSVDGVELWRMPDVLSWWAGQQSGAGTCPGTYLDVVTGEPCEAVRLWNRMTGKCAAGGQTSGVMLVSFNEQAFCSYGFAGQQGANCPVSSRTMQSIIDSLTYLSGRAPSVETTRIVHWYAGDVKPADDVLDYILGDLAFAGAVQSDDDIDEDAMTANADRLVTSPFSGSVPPDLSGMRYHILFIQPSAARMIVHRYEQGDYGDLYASVSKWFDDLRMAASNGHVPRKLPGLKSLLWNLLTDAELSKKKNRMAPLEPFLEAILDACFFGRPVPDAIGHRALAGFRSGMYPPAGEQIQYGRQYCKIRWLRLWLNRRMNMKGDNVMPEVPELLDRDSTCPAYVSGRLMAAYDAIQRTASNLKSSVVSRYFTSCSQGPAMVLGRLQSMSVHHMEVIRDDEIRGFYQGELAEIWSRMTSGIPARLTVMEQAYFACGYWQELAYIQGLYPACGTGTEAKNKKGDK